jgi:[citrate (pro-3S)-lyase] ligase
VFDKIKKRILDYIAFDTYTSGFAKIYCQRNSNYYYEIIEKFSSEHPGVTLLECELPRSPDIIKNTAIERFNKANESILFELDASIRKRYLDFPNFPLRKYADNLNELLDPQPSYIGTNGSRCFYDYHGKYVNIENGHRITPGQPKIFKHRIWCVSGCEMFGAGACDSCTISAFLQKLLNTKAPNYGFKVENYGYYFGLLNLGFGYKESNQMYEVMEILKNLPLAKGDIVISDVIPCKNQIDVLYNNTVGELSWDQGHLTENGFKLVADTLFEYLKESNFYLDKIEAKTSATKRSGSASNDSAPNYGFSEEQIVLLERYKRELSNYTKTRMGENYKLKKIGAIVMNCNPFTNGHRYLIEQASKQCDFLIVFVVQEDKSAFPFADRIELVKEGTKDLTNVGVIESGQFIISSLTFREYFNKAELQDRIIDSSNDITIFAREIAPVVNISIRFVGSEPYDRVTSQYNEMLKELLPGLGIQLKQMTRCEVDGEAISASRVRELLESKDWNSIKPLVPTVTFNYLFSRFQEYAILAVSNK